MTFRWSPRRFGSKGWFIAKILSRFIPKMSFDSHATTILFIFYLGFLSRTFTIHRTAGEGGGYLFNSLTPLYHFHPLHRHLDISWAITAGSSTLRIASSPLHIDSSWTWTGNLWFPRAGPWQLSYALLFLRDKILQNISLIPVHLFSLE